MPLVQRYKWIRKTRKLPNWIYSKPRTAAGLRTYEICADEEKKFSRAFKDAIKELQGSEEIRHRFFAAWASGDPDRAFRVLPIGGNVSDEFESWVKFFDRLDAAYASTIGAGAVEGVRRLQSAVGNLVQVSKELAVKLPPVKTPDLRKILVVPVSSESQKWIRNQSMKLVREGITNAGREQVRGYIGEFMSQGLRAESAYDKIKASIGLTDRQYEAVQHRRELLEDKGYQDADIPGMIADYEDDLLSSRAETIARTETFRAISQGRNDAWNQAAESGDLPAVERIWITPPPTPSPNAPCGECLAMNGKTAPLGGYYESDDWGPTEMPPGHPSCACDETIERVEA